MSCVNGCLGSEEGQCLGSVLLPSYHISTCDKDADGISRKFAFKVCEALSFYLLIVNVLCWVGGVCE